MASEDVARVHREAIIVEGHRDMFEMNYLAANGQQYPVLNVTLPRLKRANISTTFYAISGDSLTHANGTYRFLHAALQNIDALRTEMAASQGQMKLILHRDIICANSSQAKGRVERANGTLQDRLVKEMRLRDIDTVAAGNAFLPTFMADYNARFAKPPFDERDLHRPLAGDDDLDDAFAWKEDRTVSKNLTLQYDQVLFILEPNEITRSLACKRVMVLDYPDGRFAIRHNGVDLPYRTFDKRPQVNQAAIVENKRLGPVLAYIAEKQKELDMSRSAKAPRRRGQRNHMFKVG
jgi:hypothetical protein